MSMDKPWRLMRGLRQFTINELMTLAESAETKEFKAWFSLLLLAGYVKPAGKTDGEDAYRLIKNTGPKAPEPMEIKLVYDPNVRDYWCENFALPCKQRPYRVPEAKRQMVKHLLQMRKPYRVIAKQVGIGLGSVHSIAHEDGHHVD